MPLKQRMKTRKNFSSLWLENFAFLAIPKKPLLRLIKPKSDLICSFFVEKVGGNLVFSIEVSEYSMKEIGRWFDSR